MPPHKSLPEETVLWVLSFFGKANGSLSFFCSFLSVPVPVLLPAVSCIPPFTGAFPCILPLLYPSKVRLSLKIRVSHRFISIINANNTSPMVNSACLWRPWAYPISPTMAVVRNLTERKGSGALTLPPDTSVIAIASPRALPTPSTTAVAIPGPAAGSTAWK